MTKQKIERHALIAAGLVIVALTGVAFWLSYAHLADVAGAHGLGHSAERQWAWPATLDAFIIAGELLMLRAGLRGQRDWCAVGLTVAGSLGSIGLNVAGVGTGAAFLDYVVAAVPPAAALLAFGALMRQIRGLVAEPTTQTGTAGDASGSEVSPTPEPGAESDAAVETSQQVICGGHLPVPPVPPRSKLGTEDAREVIEAGWRDGWSVRETARAATRSTSQVQRLYARLDAEHGPAPVEGQMELAVA